MSPVRTKGKLLVAGPPLEDPNFRRTVVFMIEHTEDGALGVVLNRPSPIDLVDALPQWEDLAATPPTVFIGGPVEQGHGSFSSPAQNERRCSANSWLPWPS